MEPNNIHILLIEDDIVDVRAIQRSFKREKLPNPMSVARDGLEGLALLRGSPPAPTIPRPFLILLDLCMPRMNGIEFLAELRADPKLKDAIVFVLTTSRAERDKSAAYDKNVAGYIVKGDIGQGFSSLATMLDHYWALVELPT
ncbi:MAG: response regulator [Myxococcota bacterium]